MIIIKINNQKTEIKDFSLNSIEETKINLLAMKQENKIKNYFKNHTFLNKDDAVYYFQNFLDKEYPNKNFFAWDFIFNCCDFEYFN